MARPFKVVAAPDPGGTVVVAVTHAQLRPDGSERFWKLTRGVLDALPGHAGLHGYALRRRISGDEAWTMTAWASEEAIAAFVRSPEHREAMRATGAVLAQARFARFTIPAGEFPPTWERALAALAAENAGGADPPRP